MRRIIFCMVALIGIVLVTTAAFASTWLGPETPPVDLGSSKMTNVLGSLVQSDQFSTQYVRGPVRFSDQRYAVHAGYTGVSGQSPYIGIVGVGLGSMATGYVPSTNGINSVGIYGYAGENTPSYGIKGYSSGGTAILGISSGGSAFAGLFRGDVAMTSNLSVTTTDRALASASMNVTEGISINGAPSALYFNIDSTLTGTGPEISGSSESGAGVYAVGAPAVWLGVNTIDGLENQGKPFVLSESNSSAGIYAVATSPLPSWGGIRNAIRVVVDSRATNSNAAYAKGWTGGMYGESYVRLENFNGCTATTTGYGVSACGQEYAAVFKGNVLVGARLWMGYPMKTANTYLSRQKNYSGTVDASVNGVKPIFRTRLSAQELQKLFATCTNVDGGTCLWP